MSGKRILIIDDDLATLHALKKVLQAEGYAVKTAKSATEVLNGVSPNQPDLILLDVMIPGLSGYLACQKLKERFENCPVIMISGLWQKQDIERGYWFGADAYLTKPLDFDALFESIARLLNPQVENIT